MRYGRLVRLVVICVGIVLLPMVVEYINMNIPPFFSLSVGVFCGAMLSKRMI